MNLPAPLLVANHISFLDIFAINSITPARFVAKAEIAHWPLIGTMVTRAGTIYIERGNRRAAHAVQDSVRSELETGHSVAIFPEGTTTSGHSILPFHSALFQAAIDANAPVICLRVAYLGPEGQRTSAPAYDGDISLVQCLWRTALTSRLTVIVDPVARLDVTNCDRRHLAHKAHQAIAHHLHTFF